jgi:hypothetical protein
LTWLVLFLASLFWGQMAQGQTPVVTGFEPASGKPGTSVRVTGSGFLNTRQVNFNSVPAIFFVEDDTIIRVTVQEDAVTGPITVNTPLGTGSSGTNFTVAPRITELAPARGLSGTQVKIVGANFIGTTNVMFGGINAAFTLLSDTQIAAFVPAGANNAAVIVMTPVAEAASTNQFLVTGEPVINSFSPTTASVGQSVVIEGGDFTGATNVLFNGKAAASFAITAANQIQAVIPATATVGPISVQTPGGTAVSATNLITGNGPIISGFSPIAGPVGKQVTITGTGFSQATDVKFGGVSITAGQVTADTQIQVFVPAGATNAPISVIKGTNIFTTSSNFIVGAFPVITGFTPSSGPVGTQVRVDGENFNGVTGVKFGEIAVGFNRTADTQIFANVPTGATNAPITLITSTYTNSSTTPFLVSGSAPTLLDVFPTSGRPGGNLTLYGYGFSGVTSVKLNGQEVQSFTLTVNSGTNQIAVTLPPDATSGNFTVTTAGGTGTSSFVYSVWPHIYGFSPVKATADSLMVITGYNFNGISELRIAETLVPLNTLLIENTRISLFIPPTLRSGPVTIKSQAGLVTATNNFGMLPKITSVSPDRVRLGDQVTVEGSGFFDVIATRVGSAGTSFSVGSLNRITFTLPAVSGSDFVKVTTAEGEFTFGIRLLVFASVSQISPRFGPVGTRLTINGAGFSTVTNVQFNLVDVPVTNRTGFSIAFNVPAGRSGSVRLFNDAGITTDTNIFVLQPKLESLLSADGKPILKWPDDNVEFQLQSTESFEPFFFVWRDDEAPVFVIDNFRYVTNDSPAGMKFFRLKYDLP